MYASNINQINNPFLHDAAYVLSLRENSKGEKIFKFRSLYMNKNGECVISYYGYLTEQEIKEVMRNFCYPMEDKSYSDIHPRPFWDYEYWKGNSYENKPDYTTICTPKGLNYNKL